MEIVLSSCKNSAVDICPDRKLSDLEYTDDVVRRSESPRKFQVFFDRVNNSVSAFGIHFAPSKCKILSPNVVLARGQLNEVDRLIISHLVVVYQMKYPRAYGRPIWFFANLEHLWRRYGTRLSIKSLVYTAAVRLVLLCGFETWWLGTKDMRRILMFDHRCLPSTCIIWLGIL